VAKKGSNPILSILGENNNKLIEHKLTTSSAFLDAERNLGIKDILGRTTSADIEAVTDVNNPWDRIRTIQEGFYSTHKSHPLSHATFVKDPLAFDEHIQTSLESKFFEEPVADLKKLGLPYKYADHSGTAKSIGQINQILKQGSNVGVWNINFEGRSWAQDLPEGKDPPFPFVTNKTKRGDPIRNIIGLTDELGKEAAKLDALSWQSLADPTVKTQLRDNTLTHAQKILKRLGQSGKSNTPGILFDQAAIARGFLAKMEQKGIDTGILGDYRTGVSVDIFGQALEEAGIWKIGKEKHIGLYDAAQAHHITNILGNAVNDDAFFDKIANAMSPHLAKRRVYRAGEIASEKGLNVHANFETEMDYKGETIPIKGSRRKSSPLKDTAEYIKQRGISATYVDEFNRGYGQLDKPRMLLPGEAEKRPEMPELKVKETPINDPIERTRLKIEKFTQDLEQLRAEKASIEAQIKSTYRHIIGTPELKRLQDIEKHLTREIKRTGGSLKTYQSYYSNISKESTSAAATVLESSEARSIAGEIAPKVTGGSILELGLEYIERNPKVGIIGVAAVGAALFLRQAFTGVHPQAQIDGINRSSSDGSDFGSRRDILNSFSMRHAAGIAAVGIGLAGISAFNSANSPSTLEWGRASQFGLAAENQRGAISKDYDHGMSLSGQGITTEGTAMHAAIQAQFIAMNPKTIEEYAIWDPESKLTGHIDLVSEMNLGGKNVWVPTEIKSISEEGLAKLTTPKEGHRAQAQFYLHYLAKQAEAEGREAAPFEQFIYVSRQDPTNYKILRVDRDEQEFQFYLNRYRAYQEELKGEWATPKEMSSHFKVIKDVAAQRLEIKAKSIMYPEVKPMTPEQWGEYTRDILAREYGFKYQKRDPEELTMARIAKGLKQQDMSNVYGAQHHVGGQGSESIGWHSPIPKLLEASKRLVRGDNALNSVLRKHGISEQVTDAGLSKAYARSVAFLNSIGFRTSEKLSGTNRSIDLSRKIYGVGENYNNHTAGHQIVNDASRLATLGALLGNGKVGKQISYELLEKHAKYLPTSLNYYGGNHLSHITTSLSKLVSAKLKGSSPYKFSDQKITFKGAFDVLTGRRREALDIFSTAAETISNNIHGGDTLDRFLAPLKPGVQKLNFANLFNDPTVRLESSIIRKLSSSGFGLAGSASIARYGSIYRSWESPLHDIDFSFNGPVSQITDLLRSSLGYDGRNLELVGSIFRDEVLTNLYKLTRDKSHSIEHDALAKALRVSDEYGNLLETLKWEGKTGKDKKWVRYDSRDRLIPEGVPERVLHLDVFSSVNKSEITKDEGTGILTSNFRHAFDAKLKYKREKDIQDIFRFVEHEVVPKPPAIFSEELQSIVDSTILRPRHRKEYSTVYELLLKGDETQKAIGTIVIGNEHGNVEISNVIQEFRNKGYGKALYAHVIAERGFIRSDKHGDISEDARRVWRSLNREENLIKKEIVIEDPYWRGRSSLFQASIKPIEDSQIRTVSDKIVPGLDLRDRARSPWEGAVPEGLRSENNPGAVMKPAPRMEGGVPGAKEFYNLVRKASKPSRLTTMKRQGRTGAKYGPQMPIQNVRLNYNERTFSRMSGTVA
jgi:hypothetical protein